MSPRSIVENSLERGLDLIAVCDHNSAENVGAAIRAGRRMGLSVLAGIEISSREEVHSLAIFDEEEQALQMQDLIYQHMRGTNRPELFGDQVVVNEFDEVEGFNDRLLIGAVQLDLKDIVKKVRSFGGLSIASHVDRPSFSVLSQLGFFPDDVEFDAVEVSGHTTPKKARAEIPGLERFPVITFSDSHFPENIGKPCTCFFMKAPVVEEIRLAMKEACGRKVVG
jgi:PHP family Zn ribbon phosphoesterase